MPKVKPKRGPGRPPKRRGGARKGSGRPKSRPEEDTAERHENRWISRVQEQEEDDEFADQTSVPSGERQEGPGAEWKPTIDPDQLASLDLLPKPTTVYHDVAFKDLEDCPEQGCPRMFLRPADLLNHLAYEHHLDRFRADFKAVLEASEPEGDGKQFFCAVCGRSTYFRSSMLLHLAAQHGAAVRYLSGRLADRVAAMKKSADEENERMERNRALKLEKEKVKALTEETEAVSDVKRSNRLRGLTDAGETPPSPEPKEEQDVLTCTLCTFSFFSWQKLRSHLIRTHFHDKLLTRLRLLRVDADMNFEESVCPVCGNEYRDETAVTVHLGSAHRGVIMDMVEDEATRDLLDGFFNNANPGVFLCPICSKDLESSPVLLRHLVMAHFKEEVASRMGSGTQPGRTLRRCPACHPKGRYFYHRSSHVAHVGVNHRILFEVLPNNVAAAIGELSIPTDRPRPELLRKIQEGYKKPVPKDKQVSTTPGEQVFIKEEPGLDCDEMEADNGQDQFAEPSDEEEEPKYFVPDPDDGPGDTDTHPHQEEPSCESDTLQVEMVESAVRQDLVNDDGQPFFGVDQAIVNEEGVALRGQNPTAAPCDQEEM